MANCYICDHPVSIICARCGGELMIADERGYEFRDSGTEFRVEPCECFPAPTRFTGTRSSKDSEDRKGNQ